MDLVKLRAWGVRVANCEGCGPEDLCQVHYNELVELLLWDDEEGEL